MRTLALLSLLLLLPLPVVAQTTGSVTLADSLYAPIDFDIIPGETYSYRLERLAQDEAASVYGEVLVNIPSSPVLLLAPSPNPVGPELYVEYVLASTAPAWLELFDVAGRRIRRLDIVAPRPGQHTVALGEGIPPLANGIYFIKLTQSRVWRSSRVILVR